MSMSTHIEAFIPATDAGYQKHRKVLLACLEANVSLPKETAEYFGGSWPDTSLLDEKLEIKLEEGTHYTAFTNSTSAGFDVILNTLPKGVSQIRFYNSY